MHQLIKFFLPFVVFGMVLSGCDINISNDKIPEIPVINDDFQKKSAIYLKRVIEGDPDNAEAYYKLGKIFHEQNENKQALWNLSQAVKYDSTNAEYWVLYAGINLALNNLESAQKAIAKLEKMKEDPQGMYSIMALAAYMEGNFLRANDYLNKELLFNKDNFQTLQLRAMISLALNDTAMAEDSYLKSIEVNPGHKPTFDKLVQLYDVSGQAMKAFGFVKRYTAHLSNSDISTQMEEVGIYKAEGNIFFAKAVLKGILEKDVEYHPAYKELASLNMVENRMDSVEFYLKKAIEVKEDYHEARFELADLFDKTKRYWGALAQYQKILDFDPENELAEKELQKIKGKIAYLRKLEQADEERPIVVPLVPKQL